MQPLHSGNARTGVVFQSCPIYMLCHQRSARLAGNDLKVKTMSAIDTNRLHSGAGSFGIGSKIWSVVAAWNDARATKNALSRLSDRELDDIGLCRGDIELISRAR